MKRMQRGLPLGGVCVAALFFLVLPADGIIMSKFLHFPRAQQKLAHLAQGEITEQEETPPSHWLQTHLKSMPRALHTTPCRTQNTRQGPTTMQSRMWAP